MASALIFSRAIPQRRQWISQSHCTSNRWWNLGFICECWNQRAVKAPPNKLKKFKHCLLESWWQMFSGIGKECWSWNSCHKGPQKRP
jgi:hypothetical protein